MGGSEGEDIYQDFNPTTSSDSSTTTVWMVLFPIAGCLVSFYYYDGL